MAPSGKWGCPLAWLFPPPPATLWQTCLLRRQPGRRHSTAQRVQRGLAIAGRAGTCGLVQPRDRSGGRRADSWLACLPPTGFACVVPYLAPTQVGLCLFASLGCPVLQGGQLPKGGGAAAGCRGVGQGRRRGQQGVGAGPQGRPGTEPARCQAFCPTSARAMPPTRPRFWGATSGRPSLRHQRATRYVAMADDSSLPVRLPTRGRARRAAPRTRGPRTSLTSTKLCA